MPRNRYTPQDEKNMVTISKNLKRFAQKMGVSQTSISDSLDIPVSTLNGYFKGTSLPTPGNVEKLSNFFKVNKSEIDPRFETYEGNILDLSTIRNKKQELEARRRACTLLISLDGLTTCYDVGINTPDELAEFYDVSIKFLWQTIETYKIKLGIYFERKGYIFDLRNGLNIYKKEV